MVQKLVFAINPPSPVVVYLNLVAYNTSAPLSKLFLFKFFIIIYLQFHIILNVYFHKLYLANPGTSILVTFLFLIHTIRRLYESVCISVYSDASMNLSHYSVGLIHYWGVITVLLAYSADFSTLGIAFFYKKYLSYLCNHIFIE
jgi:hypothetical protein